MNEMTMERQAETVSPTYGVVDCDIHPAFSERSELARYLPARWQEHLRDFGLRTGNPFAGSMPYPRLTPGNGMRRDAWPPSGGPPASDLAFLQEQLLDPLNIEFGLLQPLAAGSSVFNQQFGRALCTAINDWQIDKWLSKEPRLRGAICVPQEDVEGALAEIERRASDRRFVQIAIPPRALEPAGRQRYWPIYEAAAHHGLPIGMHSAAYGSRANTGAGWTSFYIEEHYAFSNAAQTALTSMIFEGAFERYPGLKLVLVEGGFAWLPPLMWRMDREWTRMRNEVPHLTRAPSSYVGSNVWLTTQPIEEPENNRHLYDLLRWIGAGRLMFSTDYPHWDFDHPEHAFKVPLSPQDRRAIVRDNAISLFRLNAEAKARA
ncbi:amidohydrolase family protein [Mesorhizobium sp. CAU 1741]|uniref:amidohydrolase family protein n=1 Tax=Mesorhizobium sp. CAU 1741 TaxID=3140366 RepID=UPI00325B3246